MKFHVVIKLCFSLLPIFSLFSCSIITDDKVDDSITIKEIEAIRNTHVEGVNNTDVELVLKDMSSDVVYLGPGMKPLIGKKALRDFITPLYEVIRPDIKMIPYDTKIIDNTVIEWGFIEGEMAQVGIDSVQKIKFKHIFFYEKSDEGKWLITRDMYNENE